MSTKDLLNLLFLKGKKIKFFARKKKARRKKRTCAERSGFFSTKGQREKATFKASSRFVLSSATNSDT